MKIPLESISLEEKVTLIAKEYEDYAYIVSHDMGASLRHIKEFTRLLIESKQSELKDEENEYVMYINRALEKIDSMQQALLEFSRLNTRAQAHKEIDCNQILLSVLKNLNLSLEQLYPEITTTQLPVIIAEPKQIEMLFTNIIDNAVKFHEGSKRDTKIDISLIENPHFWTFKIKDNGIGIDRKYHQEIFRLFRRLDPDKYPGIGAGLTIAKKIARRHDGDIFIESSLQQGTSVIFALKKVHLSR